MKLKNRLRPRAPETLDFADRLSLFAKDTLLIELAVEQATEGGDTAGGEGYRDRAAKAPSRNCELEEMVLPPVPEKACVMALVENWAERF